MVSAEYKLFNVTKDSLSSDPEEKGPSELEVLSRASTIRIFITRYSTEKNIILFSIGINSFCFSETHEAMHVRQWILYKMSTIKVNVRPVIISCGAIPNIIPTSLSPAIGIIKRGANTYPALYDITAQVTGYRKQRINSRSIMITLFLL